VDFWKYVLIQEEANSIYIKEGRMVGQEINLYIKVPTETYETDYEMPCIMAFQVHVCVCEMSLAALRVHFPSVRGVSSFLCMTNINQSTWDPTGTFP
jgi:hypothetical protein